MLSHRNYGGEGEGGTVYVERIAWNQPPVAVASASPNPAFVGEVVSFSSAGSYDPDGRIVAYLWQFGDLGTSSEPNPTHTYEYPGYYPAWLTVTDDKSATDTKSLLIKVVCPPPTGVDVNIKNNYNKNSVLQRLRATLLRISPIQYHYIDVDIDAKVQGNLNFDKCINKVNGEFVYYTLSRIEVPENITFSKITSDTYFLNYETTPDIDDLFRIALEKIISIIFKKPPITDPQLPDLDVPDVFLRYMHVIYRAGFLPTLEGEVYSSYKNYKLPTYLDEFFKINWLGFKGDSPIDILVVDPLGREIGAFYQNGVLTNEINEIPGVAIYTGNGSEPQYILFADPIEGIYKVRVNGRGSGTYNLSIGWLHNKTVIYGKFFDYTPVAPNQTHDYSIVVDRTPPNVSILAPMNGSYTNSSTISWSASDNVGLGYFEPLVDGSSRKNVSALGNQKEGKFNTTLNLSDGLHEVEIRAFDLANNSASSYVTFTLDTIPPNISAKYPAKVPDYEQFRIEANVSGTNLADVTFLQNSTPIPYNVSGNNYASECLGPFTAGSVLSYTITAWDKAGNVASKDFNVTVVEGEVKIEGEGKNETVKLEFEAQWKKGETKGEFELQEKEKGKSEEKFKAHGKIEKLYKDCSGTFRISGTAKVEYGEEANKTRENVTFSGSVTGDKITIEIESRKFVVPVKVNVKEKIEGEKKEGKK